MKRLLSVLFWSVLAAAFIGPGTVTTAASAGSRFGLTLIWALLFSTLACFVLQEASARLTAVSGRDLASSLRRSYRGTTGALVRLLVVGAIVFGCAAYQVGNFLGGALGAELATGLDRQVLLGIFGLVAALLLWLGAPSTIARLLAVLVAVMGIGFTITALMLRPDPIALMEGLLVPRVPAGSGLLILGLVGTTVVPYNLFLGSGLAKGQDLRLMRFGMAVAVGLGGLISIAVVIAGTALSGDFSFAALAAVLSERLGPRASALVAGGLGAAGLSSAVTAPLAAAITARGLFASSSDDERWSDRGAFFRSVWLAVLGMGLAFALVGQQPIPAIIAAQALNGIVLPLVAIFLLLAVNDPRLVGREHRNSARSNLAMGLVVLVSLVLGVAGLLRASSKVLALGEPTEMTLLGVAAVVALVLSWPVGQAVARRRKLQPLSVQA